MGSRAAAANLRLVVRSRSDSFSAARSAATSFSSGLPIGVSHFRHGVVVQATVEGHVDQRIGVHVVDVLSVRVLLRLRRPGRGALYPGKVEQAVEKARVLEPPRG